MNKTLPLATFLILLLSPLALLAADPYQVVFETLDCQGGVGFATVRADQIYKINDGDCSHPDNPEQRLKQLLVKDDSGSYRAYSLSQDEARQVMKEVKEYMNARKGVLERADGVIISH